MRHFQIVLTLACWFSGSGLPSVAAQTADASGPTGAFAEWRRSAAAGFPARRVLRSGTGAAADFPGRAAKVIPISPRRPSALTIERTGETTALLKWGDGNPPWQVQRTNSPATGPWENIGGPLIVRFHAVPIEDGCAFFRVVIALPAAPGSGKKAVAPQKASEITP